MNKKRTLSPNQLPHSKKLKFQVVPEVLNFAQKRNQVVERNRNRKAGNYLLGPEISTGPVDCISHYLARKQGTREFYQLKILTLDSKTDDKNTLQGKMLLHSEFQLLSLLKDVDSVVNCHELFQDYALEERTIETKASSNLQVYTGKAKKRIILVLDNYHSSEFCEESLAYINLQQYVTKQKIPEKEALNIFYEIIKVVEILHNRNIIHRDLKLNNIILDKRNYKVILTNFCLGKFLNNEQDKLYDQRGSPAYISPDVLNGSYKGKPSDIWSCGVILYTLIFGHFPFIENTTSGLFKKIRQADYVIPENIRVSDETKKLIKSLLTLNPDERLTASEIRMKLERFKEKYQRMAQSTGAATASDDQVVPEFFPDAVVAVDPSKSNFLTDAPKFEMSTEPLSLTLEFFPSSSGSSRENKTFLKPSLLSPRLRGLSSLDSSTTASEAQNSDLINGNSNSASNIGVTRNLTRQINNLTVRNRLLSSISWHNRVSLNTNLRNLYEVRVREIANNAQTSTDPVTRSNLANHLNTLENQICLQLRNIRQSRSTSNSNVGEVPPSQSTTAEDGSNTDIQNVFRGLNRLFSSGSFPHSTDVSLDFTGVINEDIATKLASWFRSNFPHNELIRHIFCHSNGNEIANVQEFLRRFGVQMEVVSGVHKVKKEQSNQMLLFLTYLLQISGYSNSYFLNVRA